MLRTPVSRFESLISSHHSRYKVTCECSEEDINDDDDDASNTCRQGVLFRGFRVSGFWGFRGLEF